MKIQDWDNADLAIIAITILGSVASVAMLVSGAGLEAIITGCVTAIAGIARSDKGKGPPDNGGVKKP
jgi:hypothetical protein